MQGRSLQSFLEENNLSHEDWEQSKADWDVLQAIAAHHEERKPSLSTAAALIESRIRTFPGVHSVRWRVKNTDHLLEKIIRKKMNPTDNPDYLDINVETYTTVVTDLVGVRALHLFKNDCIPIDEQIRKGWDCNEVVIYTRKGDKVPEALIDTGGVEKVHPKNYRSVHYIIETKPENFLILAEIQVRTLFEEGWSEIDHTVRYPNFSDDPTIELFLGIFNGLAGNADEMGTFVKYLAQVISVQEQQQAEIVKTQNDLRTKLDEERQQLLDQVSTALEELEREKTEGAKSRALIEKLKGQVSQLKSESRILPELSASKVEKAMKFVLDPSVERAIRYGLEGLQNPYIKAYVDAKNGEPVLIHRVLSATKDPQGSKPKKDDWRDERDEKDD